MQVASSSAITLASWFTSRTGTGVPFPVDMDSMPSVGAFTSEEEAQAERSGLPVQASGPLQRLTGTPSGLLGWRRRTLAESLGGYRPSLFRRCTAHSTKTLRTRS